MQLYTKHLIQAIFFKRFSSNAVKQERVHCNPILLLMVSQCKTLNSEGNKIIKTLFEKSQCQREDQMRMCDSQDHTIIVEAGATNFKQFSNVIN